MLTNFDNTILEFIAEHLKCGFFDWFLPMFTSLGNGGLIFILTGIVFLFFKKLRRSGILMLIMLAVGAVVCNIWLKPFIARGRPFDGIEGLVLLIAAPTDFSFPSGHTAAAFEAAFAISLLGKKQAAAAYAFAVLMAFSRLYLFVHYPTDVLAGAVIGTIVSLAVYGGYLGIMRIRAREKHET